MSDQITYMLPGDKLPRKGPRHLMDRKAWKIQGARLIPDVEPVKLQPIEAAVDEAVEQEAPRRGRPRKTEADADKA